MIAITYAPKLCEIPVVGTTKSTPTKDFALFLTPLEFRTEKKGSGIILHVKPKDYLNWEFLYWVDKNGYIFINDDIIYMPIVLLPIVRR